MILTTNFDRLLEKALDEVGVNPTVISSADHARGARPLTHTKCTIIKIHGDYLDTRIKNTPDELAEYDELLNGLLDRVFDEYGLIVAGWSALWDTALRSAIERCPNHRFTTFWAARGKVEEGARGLIERRRAVLVSIEEADSFFQSLSEKVASLEQINGPHPFSAPVAAATLKRYLSEDRHRIRARDLVMDETKRFHAELSLERFPVEIDKPSQDDLINSFNVGDISYLYTSGYLPQLGGYPHGHVPSALQVADHVGDTSRRQLLRETMILTKMNWNSANFSGLMPITLRFSRLVGNILREVPTDETPEPKYKYYM